MSGFVRPAGAGERFAFGGAVFTMKVPAGDTEGRVGVMEQEAPAGLVVPPHTHDGEDEMFHVLAGRVEGYCGDDPFRAGPGDLIFLPRDVEHALAVIGEGPARLLTIVCPARFDRLVAEEGTPM
ncbi:cupin domain-containing protein [Actinomycetospora endophytica]|uniref:Cupin domain-containing protein n=1 Tax=Actinomycetospora endophytica TaxID=2291215 RepID=A0ABS8P8Z0_9PSEU|nr:cupin domain-containing protein [Actinomycetospora endophytica]MCD2194392.1 cupin domain-containing protein [Actinomycetospora endophytica]